MTTGYSPELYETMRRRFCLGEQAECARLMARRRMPPEFIPDDLLPTDVARSAELDSVC